MLLNQFLNEFPNSKEFSRKSIIILFAYYLRKYNAIVEFSNQDIRNCFRGAFIRVPSNLATLMKELSKGKSSPLIKGARKNSYSLSIYGINEVESIIQPSSDPITNYNDFIKTALPYLKRIISKVNDDNKKNFLAEAISCLGVEAKRATIILTWITAMDHLYEFILLNRLKDFNNSLARRSDRYNKIIINTKDDFGDIKESIFIEVARSAKIISNDVRKILEEKLGIRNSAAHPAAIIIHDTKVVNFIEDLVDNVIVKYKINAI